MNNIVNIMQLMNSTQNSQTMIAILEEQLKNVDKNSAELNLIKNNINAIKHNFCEKTS